MIQLPQTRRPCDVENPEDFITYYRHAIVGIEEAAGSIVPYYSIGQEARENHLFRTLRPTNLRQKSLSFRDLRAVVSFGSPDYGMVNVGPTIIYTYVTAHRGPMKGYRPANTNYAMFNTWAVRDRGDLSPQNPEVAEQLYAPSYYGPNEAEAMLEEGERVGCALSHDVGLYTQGGCSAVLCAYKRHNVGYLSGGRAMVSPHYQSMRKTLQQTLNREVVIA